MARPTCWNFRLSGGLVVDAPPMTCAEAVLPVFCNGSLRGWFLKWLLVVEAPSTRVEDSRILVVNGSDDLCGGGPRGYCIRFSIPYAGAGSLGMAVDSLMARALVGRFDSFVVVKKHS